MNNTLYPDSSSKFFRIQLTAEDEKMATNVSPLFMAYLQNKIEAYANAVVTSSLPYDADPTRQVKAILAHERLRNFVEAYEELFSELNLPST
jgi:hypothetical protein